MNLPSLSSPRFSGKQLVVGTDAQIAKMKTSLQTAGKPAKTPVEVIITDLGKDAPTPETPRMERLRAYVLGNAGFLNAVQTILNDTFGKGLSLKSKDLKLATVLTGEDATTFRQIKPQYQVITKTLKDVLKTLRQAELENSALKVASTRNVAVAKEALTDAKFQAALFQSFGQLVAAGIIKPEAVQVIAGLQEDAAFMGKVGLLVEAASTSAATPEVKQAANDVLEQVCNKLCASPEMAKALQYTIAPFLNAASELYNLKNNPSQLGTILPKLPIPVTTQTLTQAVKKSGLAPAANQPLVPNRTVKVDIGAFLTLIGHVADIVKTEVGNSPAITPSIDHLFTEANTLFGAPSSGSASVDQLLKQIDTNYRRSFGPGNKPE